MKNKKDVYYALTQLFEKDEVAGDGTYVNWDRFVKVLNHPDRKSVV